MLPGGSIPRDAAATARDVSISDYNEMRDIRRREVRKNLIGLLIARSLHRREITPPARGRSAPRGVAPAAGR
ncbi:hypothetical protein TPB0596_25730 [Tsukamurella pulmonis]|nr:hypothetical protein TPB0596_25730 [Tsukamurella pulmonis]